MSIRPQPTDCPDCKEYLDQILELKKILKDNNEKMSIAEIGYESRNDELHDELIDARYELKMCKKLLSNQWDKDDELN
jgi:hypothetical protein